MHIKIYSPYLYVVLPFFFLLGPFEFTSVVTCNTSGSSVFSTDIVRISKLFGSHRVAICPKSFIVPILLCLQINLAVRECKDYDGGCGCLSSVYVYVRCDHSNVLHFLDTLRVDFHNKIAIILSEKL